MNEHEHTVLVVDDDEGIRAFLGRWVKRLGYGVKVADSSSAALQVLATSSVDVVICDIRMPGADGIWLTDRIHEQFPTVPVVLATGLDVDKSIVLRPGVVAYVVKPFRSEEMIMAIRTGLAWREAQVTRPDGYFVVVEQLHSS